MNWFTRLLMRRARKQKSYVEEAVTVCPVCSGAMPDHHRKQIATKLDGSGVQEFLNLASTGNWNELVKYREWEWNADVWTVYGVACPKVPERMALLVFWDPGGFFQGPNLHKVVLMSTPPGFELTEKWVKWDTPVTLN